jgi:hypothetical protein
LLSLWGRKESEEAIQRQKQGTGITAFQVGSWKEIGTDHLQAVASGFIGTQHQCGCFQGSLAVM